MTKIKIQNYEMEVSPETSEIYNFLKSKASVSVKQDFFIDMFVKFFVENYHHDIAGYYSDDKMSRSNWTHLTANTFFKTSQMLGYLCDFEVEKRHDGAIRDEKGKVYLAAEWEYDTNSIFQVKGEIEKLYNTCKKFPDSQALLFTYKVGEDFPKLVEKIFEKWQSLHSPEEDFSLFILTAIFKNNEEEKVKYFQNLQVVVLTKTDIEIWETN